MPAHSQLDIEVSPHGFVAVVTPPRDPLTLISIPLQIIVLGLLCGFIISVILYNFLSPIAVLASFATFLICCFGAFALSSIWRWTAFGREIIEVNQNTLKVTGFRKLEQFTLSELWGFSVEINELPLFLRWRLQGLDALSDSVFFYGHKVGHSLGCRLSEADAKTLIDRIQMCQRAIGA